MPPITATRWTQGNDTLITLTTDNGVHDIDESIQPSLEDWHEQPDEVREAVHDFYRLIRV